MEESFATDTALGTKLLPTPRHASASSSSPSALKNTLNAAFPSPCLGEAGEE
jgi:hypothetical protein